MPKKTKPAIFLLCSVLGMGYFNAFSSIDLNPILKNYLALVPVQIGLVVYFLWFRRDPTSENE